MKGFIRKFFLFVSPFLLLLLIYFVWDPFKVVHHHSPYYSENDYIGINRGYVSAMTYKEQNEKFHYDSFIFGNSRSIFYQVDSWKKYLTASSSCYHFDASGGSVSGLYEKISYIDKNGGQINNALFVLDYSVFDRLEQEGHLFQSAPILRNSNTYWLKFHLDNLKAFFTPRFLCAIFDYALFHTIRPYMGFLLDNRRSVYDGATNELRSIAENYIQQGTYYDEKRIRLFDGAQFPGKISENTMTNQKVDILYKIAGILKKHNTTYKIVISPLYDQIKMNPQVLEILISIFGQEHIYDFSGPNKWNQDYHNYYETSHYRPHVSYEIMALIYGCKD